MNSGHDTREASPASPDALLLVAIAAGDQAALASFYARHSKRIYSVALRILRDPSAAEDVLQDVITQVWRKPTAFSAIHGSLEGWLAVVAKNRSIDIIRSRKPSDPLEDVVLISSQNVASEVEENLTLAQVKRRMATLPEEQRRVVEMAYFEGLTHSEIAKALGDPLGTVKTRIRFALQSLRRDLLPS